MDDEIWIDMDDEIACKNCKFAEFDPIEDLIGECHRYPPTPVYNQRIFPVMDIDDWCGEFVRSEDG